MSERSHRAENKTEGLNKWDICKFESENKKLRTSHMIDEHDDCYCCYLCDYYFETNQSLKYHNEFIHKEYCDVTESEGEEVSQYNKFETQRKIKVRIRS